MGEEDTKRMRSLTERLEEVERACDYLADIAGSVAERMVEADRVVQATLILSVETVARSQIGRIRDALRLDGSEDDG